jgi:hypothetical protein
MKMIIFILLVCCLFLSHNVFAEMYLDNNGNVGIGTTAPGSKLSVNGTIESQTGGIKFPDGTTQTTAATGNGDITAVNAGAGLNGGGTTGDVTLNADTTYLQRRINGKCSAGSSIRTVNNDGTVTCEQDNDSGGDITSVSAGSGLAGGGTSGDVAIDVNFSGTGSALSVSRSDHEHDTLYQKKYSGVAVVAVSGGDYSDPYGAINDISAWCGTPSNANPCLLKVMPGVYDINANSLQMVDYVDIEGSGESVTRITGNRGSYPGVVAGSDNAEIRFITIENTGGGSYAYALSMINSSPKVTNVTAIASGANQNIAVDSEVNLSSIFKNVTAIASGGSVSLGFYIDTASPTLVNVTANASDAAYNLAIDMNVTSSPIMTNVTATALRGTDSHGIHINGTSSPVMRNVTAIAADAENENYGIDNRNSSSPVLTGVKAVGSGGAYNYGIYNRNYASYTGGTLKIDHSVIEGTTASIYTDTTFTSLIGNTRLAGSVTGPGTKICAGVYDENYTFYSSSCP